MSNFRVFHYPIYIVIVLTSLDFIFRFTIIRSFSSENLLFYSLSVLLSLLFWFLIFDFFLIAKRFGKLVYLPILSIFAIFYSFLIIGSYSFYQFSSMLPNFFTISYLFQEPFNSYTLIRDGLSFSSVLFFILGVLALFIFLHQALHKKEKVVIWKFTVIFLLVSLLFPFLIHNTRYKDQVYCAETNGYSFIARILYNKITGNKLGSAGLQSRTSKKLQSSNSSPKFNVVLILAESLRKKSMSLYGYKKDTTPNLRNFKSSNPENLFLFERAFSNATSTLISLPSILTGVLPNESTAKIHNHPIFWEFGKAKNYSTFYITSHDHKWNNLNGYFANAGIDYLWNRDSFLGNLYNDLGIDDRETLKETKAHLRKLKQNQQKFFGVFHLNTNHFPYFHPEEMDVWKVEKGKLFAYYDNSVLFFDSVVGEFLNFLQEENLDEDTILILTSDHGESVGEHGYVGHIESNYLETISIPLFIYIPEKIQKEIHLQKTELKKNLSKNVMNGDIIPTIIDLLDQKNTLKWKSSQNQISGKSLFGPIPTDREILIVNNNEISLYNVGFSLIKKNLHYIYKVIPYPTDEELFDIHNDPDETKNLWDTSSSDLKKEILHSFQNCSICNTVRKPKK